MRTKALALVLLLPSVHAQEADRVRLRGLVRDVQDKPWQGARVHLFARPVPGIESIGKLHRLQVTTDERGRFEARILPHRQYVVWAVSEPEAGVYRVTHPLEGIRAGRPVRLVEQAEPFVQPILRIKPGEWKDRGPFRVLVTSVSTGTSPLLWFGARTGRAYVLACPNEDALVARLPLLPWGSCTAEVYDKSGILLVTQGISLPRRARQVALERKARAGKPVAGVTVASGPVNRPEDIVSLRVTEVRIPAGKTEKLEIRLNERGGDPIPGAKIYQRVRGRLVRLTEADAEGRVEIRLPQHTFVRNPLLASASTPGLVVLAHGFGEVPARDSAANRNVFGILVGGPKNEKKGKSIAVLKKERVFEGRLRLGGRPLANTTLLLTTVGESPVPFFPIGSMTSGGPVITTTDAEGRFRFPNRTECSYLLFAKLDDASLRALGDADETAPFPVVLLKNGRTGLKGDVALGDIELGKLRRLELLVTGPDGSLQANARIAFVETRNQFPQAQPLLAPVTDRRGKAVLYLDDVSRMSVLAYADVGYRILPVGEVVGVLEVRLQRPKIVEGIVKNGKGEPQSGLLVQCMPMNLTIGDDWYALMSLLGHRFFALTDKDGRFSIWIDPKNEQASLQVCHWDGQRMTNSVSRQIDVEEIGARPIEIEHPGSGRGRAAGMAARAVVVDVAEEPETPEPEKGKAKQGGTKQKVKQPESRPTKGKK